MSKFRSIAPSQIDSEIQGVNYQSKKDVFLVFFPKDSYIIQQLHTIATS